MNPPPLDTLVLLIHLSAAGHPVALPDVMPTPMSHEACRALQKDQTALAGLTAKTKSINPDVARSVVGCHHLNREDARALGRALLDGNP